MRACGMCKRTLGDESGCLDLVRSKSGHFRMADLCSVCCSGFDQEASTIALVKATVGFTAAALLCSVLSYVILGFM